MGKEGVKIEIMDTTLRDGEQTSGVSFVPHAVLRLVVFLHYDIKHLFISVRTVFIQTFYPLSVFIQQTVHPQSGYINITSIFIY